MTRGSANGGGASDRRRAWPRWGLQTGLASASWRAYIRHQQRRAASPFFYVWTVMPNDLIAKAAIDRRMAEIITR
jgi:hypothetical protein